MIGLLLRLRDDGGDDLAVVMDLIVLKDRQAAVADRGRIGDRDQRGAGHARHIMVGEDQQHAIGRLGARRAEPRDPPARDRAVDERGVAEVVQRHFGGKARLSLHLGIAIEPRRLPPHFAAAADQRVGRATGQPLRGNPAECAAHRADEDILYPAHA